MRQACTRIGNDESLVVIQKPLDGTHADDRIKVVVIIIVEFADDGSHGVRSDKAPLVRGGDELKKVSMEVDDRSVHHEMDRC